MKREKGKIDILFLGRFSSGEILSGPEKTAKRIFSEHIKYYKSCFIQYFFDGTKYSFFKKIFGKENTGYINSSEILTLGLFRIIIELIKRRPKTIHIITFERFAVLALISKILFGSKIVFNAHGIVAYENNELKKTGSYLKLKDRICEKLFFKYSDILIFYSENSIDIAEKYFKIDESKAVILSGGIDESFYCKSPLPKTNSCLRIVIQHFGEFKKSSAEFLKAALNKISNPAEIYVIGRDEGFFTEINPVVKINFTDKLNTEQLAGFYSDKDIFLSLNKYDTFSISTAEAMAAGLVPIVTEETGISRYIENGENGFTVKYGDTFKLAQILNYLNDDFKVLENLSSGSAKIREMLSWHDVYDTYRNIYLSIEK